jgi:hypothetical protein
LCLGLRDGYGVVAVAIAQADSIVRRYGRSAAMRTSKDRNRSGARVVAARGIAAVLTAGVDILDHGLCVRTIIRFDGGRDSRGGCQDGWWKGYGVEISSLGWGKMP